MAHTTEDAQNFATEAGKLAEFMAEFMRRGTALWVEFPDFCEAVEFVTKEDLEGSSYEGLDPTIPVQAYAMVSSLMPALRSVYKELKKFK